MSTEEKILNEYNVTFVVFDQEVTIKCLAESLSAATEYVENKQMSEILTRMHVKDFTCGISASLVREGEPTLKKEDTLINGPGWVHGG
ncbi:MAG: hypothetical protein DRQ47_04505 [Gammaproteobacteria bacterium]|nr:MAG: hypothetical protein DRQ47_04505 [Gammaproteobacteria bacterium]